MWGNNSSRFAAKKSGTKFLVFSSSLDSHFRTSSNVPTPDPTIKVFKPQFFPKSMSVSALSNEKN